MLYCLMENFVVVIRYVYINYLSRGQFYSTLFSEQENKGVDDDE